MSTQNRIYGLDAIRLVSFFAIATFHISLIHYFETDIIIANESIIIRIVEQIARALAFSGFTIAFLTSLLTAISSSSNLNRIRLFSFLVFGWFVFSALMNKPDDMFLVWDIYPLLFSGILVATIIDTYMPRLIPALGIIGFCMLWVPFWDLLQLTDPNVSDAWIVFGLASCDVGSIEWPILPWIGLPWFGYAVGYALKGFTSSNSLDKLNLKKKEALFWAVALGASIFGIGGFYNIKLGSSFSCDAYRQPPFIWWAHFSWVLFFIRVSFDARVQAKLGSVKLFRFISNLAISRKFWLAYFLNYLLAFTLSWIVETTEVEKTSIHVPVIATIAVCFVPFTEVVLRITLIIWSKVSAFWQKKKPS
jgi:hypothetical protein